MTKVIFNIKPDMAYFDCLQHSEDHDVCTIVSTLCNVLVAECMRSGVAPKVYAPGHVCISAEKVDAKCIEVFEAVHTVFAQVEEQHSENVKLY